MRRFVRRDRRLVLLDIAQLVDSFDQAVLRKLGDGELYFAAARSGQGLSDQVYFYFGVRRRGESG